MVNISTRMRKLNTLLGIRLGPGAAILPNNVTKVHLEMATKIDGGHRGGRKFWRHMLPRLAYHNPSIPMTVSRSEDKESPCTLSIHLSPSSTNTSSPSPTSNTTPRNPDSGVVQIDMKMKQESEILKQLMEVTGAQQVEPTPMEVEMMRELEEQRVRSERDSVRSRAARAQWKKEQEMLRQAREGAM